VASANLDVTSQNLLSLAKHCGWLPYYIKFLQHVYFAIWGYAYFMTLKFSGFAKILYFESL